MNQENNFSPLSPTRFFTGFCFLYALLWVLIPLWVRGNAPVDALEGVAWGHLGLWGYTKHPPLAPWLTAWGADHLGSVDLAIYLLSQLAVITCLIAVWRLALRFVNAWQACISALLLTAIYYYNMAATQFNPNVLMLPLWALVCLFLYRALEKQKGYDWILTGVFIGLAMLTKYQSGLLVLSVIAVVFLTAEGRESLRRPWVYCAGILSILIFLPHFNWVYQNNYLPFQYTLARLGSHQLTGKLSILNHIYQPLRFLGEQLLAVIPILIMGSPLYRRDSNQTSLNTFQWQFLLLMGLGPFALTLLLSAATGVWLHALWAFPFFSLSGLILVAWYRPLINALVIKRFCIGALLILALTLSLRAIHIVGGPFMRDKTTSAHFPGTQIAHYYTNYWHEHVGPTLPYIIAPHFLAVHIAAYSSDKPIPFFNLLKQDSPWIKEEALHRQGAMIVGFENDPAFVKQIQQRYPEAKPLGSHAFSQLTGANTPPIKLLAWQLSSNHLTKREHH